MIRLHVLLAVLLTVSLRTHVEAQLPQTPAGLTRDSCDMSTDCKGSRMCYELFNITLLPPEAPCPRFDTCRCVPPEYISCQSTDVCSKGEVCARTLRFPFVCTSDAHVSSLESRAVIVEDSVRDPLVPECIAPQSGDFPKNPDAPKKGVVLDACNPGSCAEGLSCIVELDNPVAPYACCADATVQTCVCHAMDTRPLCNTSDDCHMGEVCGKSPILPQQCYNKAWLQAQRPALWDTFKVLRGMKPAPSQRPTQPTRPTESPDADGTGEANGEVGASGLPETDPTPEDEVCVDANALRHLPRSALVYERDLLARVLCDASGSCATAGHMVTFRNRPMMMKTYCASVGCVEKIMRVNSPRYRRAYSLPTATDGLAFTTFAARYSTIAEEGMLSAAVRLGL